MFYSQGGSRGNDALSLYGALNGGSGVDSASDLDGALRGLNPDRASGELNMDTSIDASKLGSNSG